MILRKSTTLFFPSRTGTFCCTTVPATSVILHVQELDWAYPAFVEACHEYKKEYDLPEDLNPLPIGGFGEGSIAVLEQNSGKVLMLIHDYAGDYPFQEVAPHFNGLMEMLAGSAIWVQEQMK